MDWLDSVRTSTPEYLIALRLLLAAGLGAVIGFERESKDRDAGLRTHMLTALAAALFTVITAELFHDSQGAQGPGDPIRIIEAVTAGIFGGRGNHPIARRGKRSNPGAGMWLAGAIGVAAGGGYYSVAVMGTVLAVVIL